MRDLSKHKLPPLSSLLLRPPMARETYLIPVTFDRGFVLGTYASEAVGTLVEKACWFANA